MTEYLGLEDALALIEDLHIGPIRDIGLLDSALHRPQVMVFGSDVYPSLEIKAAVLLESLVRNHPLVDGNKRLGWLATVVFFGLNDVDLDADDDAAYDVVVGLASGALDHESAAAQLLGWF
ncbi:MAG: type II toxin-antitoxin system death-on-curing family toxin [Micrococcales bacterium]|nr:type II toxin-antitoxin system death-on-curing family toxin [Micrococcales bacterium]